MSSGFPCLGSSKSQGYVLIRGRHWGLLPPDTLKYKDFPSVPWGKTFLASLTSSLKPVSLHPLPFLSFLFPSTDQYFMGISVSLYLPSYIKFSVSSFSFFFWGCYTLKVPQTSYFRGPAILFALKAEEAGKATLLSAFGLPGVSNSQGHTSARDIKGGWNLLLEFWESGTFCS